MGANSIIAGRLLGLALAAVLVQGCLVAQENPGLDDQPVKRNIPPKLLTDTAVPAQRDTVIKIHQTCLPTVPNSGPFGIGVFDPDEDVIEARWFVDHDPNFTTLPINGKLDSNNTPERVFVRPLDLFYATGELIIPKKHYVTVVVSDRPFEAEGIEVRLGQVKLRDGGTVLETTETARYTWEVTTDMAACP